MKSLNNKILICIWVVLLIFPFVFAHRSKEQRVSNMENRMLAPYPDFVTEAGINRNYISEYEDWIQDNFRGRSIYVKLNSTLQYKLLNHIIKSDSIVGKNGWIFVNSETQIQEYQRLNYVDESTLSVFSEQIEKLDSWCENHSISFYYLQCYDKEEIYPQEYVEGINRVGDVSIADQVQETLDSKDISFVNYKNLLEEESKNSLIYFKYVDSLHWNERGSYIGYSELMKTIHNDYSSVTALAESDFEIGEEEQSLELYGYEYPLTEMVPYYQIKNPTYVEITGEKEDELDFLHYKEHTHLFINPECNNDIKAVVIGDSFTRMFMKENVAQGFGQMLYCDAMNISCLDEIQEYFNPDIVILEATQNCTRAMIERVNEITYLDD